MITAGILYICVSSVVGDLHKFYQPEEGIGHAAYSYSIPFYDLERESFNECEIAHPGDKCSTHCYESRGVE